MTASTTRTMYEDTLHTLSTASVHQHFDAFVDVPWDDPAYAVVADDPRWVLPEFDPLGATAWYQSLPLQRQIDFISSPDAVSTDFVGSRHAAVIDAEATIVNNGRHCVLYVWYDNEFGYSCQVVRLLQQLSGVVYPIYPKD